MATRLGDEGGTKPPQESGWLLWVPSSVPDSSPPGLAGLLQIVVPLQGPHTIGQDVEAPILQISESYIESSPQ